MWATASNYWHSSIVTLICFQIKSQHSSFTSWPYKSATAKTKPQILLHILLCNRFWYEFSLLNWMLSISIYLPITQQHTHTNIWGTIKLWTKPRTTTAYSRNTVTAHLTVPGPQHTWRCAKRKSLVCVRINSTTCRTV